MKRATILKKIEQIGIIAVVRGKSKEQALAASSALIKGGITGIEVTYTIDHASEVIETLVTDFSDQADVVVGAGTVLDAVTARLAILAGAEYIVSPSFDKKTAELCNLYQIPYLPGCMTITEMKEALLSGVDIVKLFPGSVYGPEIIQAFKAPLPQLNIMPTGGVNLANMQDWFAQGALAVGVGGSLLAPAATGDFDKITELAQQYSDMLKKIRGKADG